MARPLREELFVAASLSKDMNLHFKGTLQLKRSAGKKVCGRKIYGQQKYSNRFQS